MRGAAPRAPAGPGGRPPPARPAAAGSMAARAAASACCGTRVVSRSTPSKRAVSSRTAAAPRARTSSQSGRTTSRATSTSSAARGSTVAQPGGVGPLPAQVDSRDHRRCSPTSSRAESTKPRPPGAVGAVRATGRAGPQRRRTAPEDVSGLGSGDAAVTARLAALPARAPCSSPGCCCRCTSSRSATGGWSATCSTRTRSRRELGVVAIREGREVGADGSGHCTRSAASRGCAGSTRMPTAASTSSASGPAGSGSRVTSWTAPCPTCAAASRPAREPAGKRPGSRPLRTVRALLRRLPARRSGGDRAGTDADDLPDDPRLLSYLVAATMVLDLTDRQRLLEAPDTTSRLRAETAAAAPGDGPAGPAAVAARCRADPRPRQPQLTPGMASKPKASSGGTPATVALTRAGVAFDLHPYEHEPGPPVATRLRAGGGRRARARRRRRCSRRSSPGSTAGWWWPWCR